MFKGKQEVPMCVAAVQYSSSRLQADLDGPRIVFSADIQKSNKFSLSQHVTRTERHQNGFYTIYSDK